MAFFESFTSTVEAAQESLEIMRSAPLREAEMALKDYEASRGDVDYLKIAREAAMKAVVLGALDVKLSAAIIAVSAGYVYKTKMDSPSDAKYFTVNGTLSNIVQALAPFWANPSCAATADGKKTLSFLLNLVSCVCVLPTDDVPVLPKMDKRLLPAFGVLCAAEPELRHTYPAVAGAAVKAMLEGKTMKGLWQLAEEVGVDVEDCTSKHEIVQALLASGKSLVPGTMTRGEVVVPQETAVRPKAVEMPLMRTPIRNAATDRAALMEVYNATGGPSWKNKKGWGTTTPLGDWYGVTVNDEGRVVKLTLNGNGLKGPILKQLGEVTKLEVLLLDDNKLTGPIPSELGNLATLQRLDLDNNELSGHIPRQLGNLSALETLDLSANKLDGPIPKELGALTKLEWLELQGNQLSGPIPPEVGNLRVLKELLLFNNQLTGPIPPEVGNLGVLKELLLSNNHLTGIIPKELGALPELQVLSLSSNKLTGTIPPELGRLSALQTLWLNYNNLTGPIPQEVGNLGELKELWLYNNQLTGDIPPQLGQLGALEILSLANNKFYGTIPPELGRLAALQTLRLSSNNLTGAIPAQLGDLNNLTWLDLSDNQLSGGVPTALEKHSNRQLFSFGVPPDGAPVPPWTSWMNVVVPLLLGYLDLGTDVLTVVSFYKVHWWWFALSLTFVVGPALVAAIFFLGDEHILRRIAVALHAGLLNEALVSIARSSYSHVLVSLRVVEPLYESVPQLMLQTYALLQTWNTDSSHWSQWLAVRIFSIVVSCSSLAYAITGLVAEHPFSGLPPAENAGRSWCPFLTGLLFGTVPAHGSVEVYRRSRWHPQNFVWAFLLYQVLEIGARFISLALLALVLRAYFFLLLVYLWISRFGILRHSLGSGHENLRFRSQVRLVGMPFMDSVMDGLASYDQGCALTTVEFLVFLLVGNFAPTTYGADQAPDNVRHVWSYAAVVLMVGKLALGFHIVRPFKRVAGFGYGKEQAPGSHHARFGNGDVEQGRGARVGNAMSEGEGKFSDVQVGECRIPEVVYDDEVHPDERGGARVQGDGDSVMQQRGSLSFAGGEDKEGIPHVQDSSAALNIGETGCSAVVTDDTSDMAETENSKVDHLETVESKIAKDLAIACDHE